MALKTPTRVAGGDYLDLNEMVKAGPVLVLFRVVQFLPAELDNYNRNTYPVRADALICSGPRMGEVIPASGNGFKFSASVALRGITVGASDDGEQPKNAPGDELPYTVQTIKPRKGQPFTGLDGADPNGNDEERAAYAQIVKVREQRGGDGWWAAARPPFAAEGEQAAPAASAPAQEPAMAGAAAPAASAPAGPHPWER